MAITINTNTSAMVAQRNLTMAATKSGASLAKLSSGSRVPTAKDDAAALAIGSRLNSEVVSLRQAGLNAGQASSLLQIADGAMGQIADVLARMQALAVQAKSGQLSSVERGILNTEFTQLRDEVTRIADDTTFNGTKLVASSTSVGASFNDLTANSLASKGVSTVEFDSTFPDGAISITYDATGGTNGERALTVKNLETLEVETVNLSSTTLNGSESEEAVFGSIGVTVTLDSSFDKTADIAASAGTSTFAGNSTGAIEASSIKLVSLTTDGTTDGAAAAADGSNSFTFGGLDTAAVTLASDGTGAPGAVIMTTTINGQQFDSAATDFSSLGTKTLTFTDTANAANTFTIEMNVTEVLDGTNAQIAGSVIVNDFGTMVAADTATSGSSSFTFQIGTGTTANVDDMSVTLSAVDASSLGIGSLTVDTASNASTAIDTLATAVTTLNTARASVGAAQSRLDFASANISVAIENNSAAKSALMDVDVSSEMTEFTSKQVLIQAGVSMLAQANQQPGLLLKLLG